jgi:ribosomal protein S12 methylthiotransferase
MNSTTAPKVGMISLGCAKNLVDAEIMLGGIVKEGMQITADADEADVLIVNTCAFIDSAKEESIEAILESHENRGLKKRAGQRLIVTGCMAQRFSKELSGELSEVDAFLGLDQVADAGKLVRQNFYLAIGYNIIAVPLAFAGLATPLVAAIAMSSSSIVVVLNSLRMSRWT